MYAMKIDNPYMNISYVKQLHHNAKYQHIYNIHVTSENHKQSCANKYYNLSHVMQFL